MVPDACPGDMGLKDAHGFPDAGGDGRPLSQAQPRLHGRGVGVEKLPAGVRTPFGHKHSQQEEIYVIAEGSGRIKLDDEVRDLRQWDVIRIGPGVMRNLEAGSEGITVIAFGAPVGEENDGEIVPGWWTG